MKRWMTTAMAALAASFLAVSCDGESDKSAQAGGSGEAAPGGQETGGRNESAAGAAASGEAAPAGDQAGAGGDAAPPGAPKAAPKTADEGFIAIPGGTFALPGEASGVELAAFQMGVKPVSTEEFQKCVEAGQCPESGFVKFSAEVPGKSPLAQCNYGREGRGGHPMNCVTWNGAARYCKFIGGRLPTAAEWKYAATHDGQKPRWTKYPWGDEEPVHCKTASFRKSTGAGLSYYCAESGRSADASGTPAIGAHSPAGDSPLGLTDMTGSVSQWTMDAAGAEMVILGGSWSGDASQLEVNPQKMRTANGAQASQGIGFRCLKGGLPHGVGPTKDGYIALPGGVLHSKMGNVPQAIQGFELAVRPVTVDEFAKCVEAGKCPKDGFTAFDKTAAADTPKSKCRFGRKGYGDHPMNCVGWSAAASYCRFAGGRLPTLFEWEYAATHDGAFALQTKYPWGDEDPVHCRTASFTRKSESGRTYYCSGKSRSMDSTGTAPVGTYAPANDSPLGLVDMSGNVAQWTADRGSEPGKYFIKGGDYSDAMENLAVSPKGGSFVLNKTGNFPSVGFRCARGGADNESSLDPMAAELPWKLKKGEKASDVPIPNPENGITAVNIPAGTYTGRRSKKTEQVAAFRMAKNPVSVIEYAVCVLAGGCDMRRHHALFWDQAGELHKKFCNLDAQSKGEMPINCVDQAGAAEYCRWTGGRLPTDTEWKYAATHDGTKARQTDYPWGDKAFQKHCVNASYLQFTGNGPKGAGDYYCDGKTKVLKPAGTSIIGTYSPAGDSPLGLVDMSGNVGEWTSTLLPGGKAAVNGGGWDQNVIVMEVDSRTAQPQTPSVTSRDPNLGFRCVWPAK